MSWTRLRRVLSLPACLRVVPAGVGARQGLELRGESLSLTNKLRYYPKPLSSNLTALQMQDLCSSGEAVAFYGSVFFGTNRPPQSGRHSAGKVSPGGRGRRPIYSAVLLPAPKSSRGCTDGSCIAGGVLAASQCEGSGSQIPKSRAVVEAGESRQRLVVVTLRPSTEVSTPW